MLLAHAQLITDIKSPRVEFLINEKDEFVMYDGQYLAKLLDQISFYQLDNEFQILKGISTSKDNYHFYNPQQEVSFNNDVFAFATGCVKNQLIDSLFRLAVLFDFSKESLRAYSFGEEEFEGGIYIESFQNMNLIALDKNNTINLHLIQDYQFVNSFEINLNAPRDFSLSDVLFLDRENAVLLFSSNYFSDNASLLISLNLIDKSWKANIIYGCTLRDINHSFSSFITCTGLTSKYKNETKNDLDGILVEIDNDLNLTKSLLIYADNFRFSEITLVPISNQEYLLAYATYTRFPVIFTKFSQDFELLSQQGVDFLNPDIIFGNNNNLYIFSDEENFQRILNKTNLNSNLNECPNYSACLKTKAIDLNKEEVELTFSEIDSLEHFELDWQYTMTSFSPYECQDNPLPSPTFSIPDTICIGDCIETQATDNEFAQYREWQLDTPKGNITILDSLNIDTCLNELGTYNLKQKIWVLGCEYEFDKDIEVINSIDVLMEDEEICDNETLIEIMNNGNSNLTAKWTDGSLGLQREILESGYYEATVTNGFCDTIVGANITLESDEIQIEEILVLPADMLVCTKDLPIIFELPFFENEGIFLNGILLDSNTITISEPGLYNFITIINGCQYEKNLNVEIDSCFSQIYFPTAFSPNGDGINDQFEPLGDNFIPVSLEIYSRWGTQITTNRSSWDGTLRGKPLNPDLFFYIFTYENTLTEEIEQESGCLTLIR